MSDHSDPHKFTEGVTPVNDDMDPKDFPCRWTTFSEVTSFFLDVSENPDVRVLGLDFEDGFEHLDAHPSIRHRIVFQLDELVWIKIAATFGLRSTPGEFCNLVDLTLLLLEWYFRGRVKAISHMDDLSVAILDPLLSHEEIIDFIQSFGWKLNVLKTELPTRTPTHVGCDWNLDTLVVSIKESKRVKYIVEVEEMINRGEVKPVLLKEAESIIGKLQYCTNVRRDLRHLLAPLYRFRRGYLRRHAGRLPTQ